MSAPPAPRDCGRLALRVNLLISFGNRKTFSTESIFNRRNGALLKRADSPSTSPLRRHCFTKAGRGVRFRPIRQPLFGRSSSASDLSAPSTAIFGGTCRSKRMLPNSLSSLSAGFTNTGCRFSIGFHLCPTSSRLPSVARFFRECLSRKCRSLLPCFWQTKVGKERQKNDFPRRSQPVQRHFTMR